MSAPIPSDLVQIVSQIFLDLQALRSEVQALRCEVAGKIQQEGWADPTEAAAALKAEGIKSPSHLKRLRLKGALSEARGEFRGGGTKAASYHIPKCRTALQRYFKRRDG